MYSALWVAIKSSTKIQWNFTDHWDLSMPWQCTLSTGNVTRVAQNNFKNVYFYLHLENIITIFVLIAAHVHISAHPSYFEVISHKMINHLPRSIHKASYWVQCDWELAWNRPKSSILGLICATNNETNNSFMTFGTKMHRQDPILVNNKLEGCHKTPKN